MSWHESLIVAVDVGDCSQSIVTFIKLYKFLRCVTDWQSDRRSQTLEFSIEKVFQIVNHLYYIQSKSSFSLLTET
jgi:hypothetical protein